MPQGSSVTLSPEGSGYAGTDAKHHLWSVYECLGGSKWLVNLFTMLIELTITHPTEAAHRTVEMIVKGRYKNKFWLGVIGIGNILPIAMLMFGTLSFLPVVAILVILGIYLTESIWVEAPQRIPLA